MDESGSVGDDIGADHEKAFLFEQVFETFGLHLLNQEVIKRAGKITDSSRNTDN